MKKTATQNNINFIINYLKNKNINIFVSQDNLITKIAILNKRTVQSSVTEQTAIATSSILYAEGHCYFISKIVSILRKKSLLSQRSKIPKIME